MCELFVPRTSTSDTTWVPAKMLSGWCDIRHKHKEADGQTRAARIHCENPATSSDCPVQIEFNLNPVKRTFDEELLALNKRTIPASQSCSPAYFVQSIVHRRRLRM